MLVKFTPEQVAQLWPLMTDGIDSALPPYVGNKDARLRNILSSILSGVMDCWVSYDIGGKDGGAMVLGVVLTVIKADEFSGSRYLLIYAVHGVNRSANRHWAEGYNTLRTYAAENGCETIIGYSRVPEIAAMAQRLGGDTEYRLIQLPVSMAMVKNSP